jgi:hypothetical protein
MATVGLKAVGNTLFGPVGGFIGGAAGAYIDSNFLIPALFPPDDIEGPRIGEISLQTQDEGAPMNFCIGPTCRTAGTVIWVGKPIIEEEEQDVRSPRFRTSASIPVQRS